MTEPYSTVEPQAAVAAETNVVPPGHQALFTRTGARLIVADADAPRVLHELGLITVQYDLEQATADLLAQNRALADTISNSAAEVAASGYIDETLEGVINRAVGEFRAAFEHWSRCLGALVPTEATVRDVAVHKDLRGDLRAVPSLARHEAVADAYAAAHDLSEHIAAERAREAAELAARGGA